MEQSGLRNDFLSVARETSCLVFGGYFAARSSSSGDTSRPVPLVHQDAGFGSGMERLFFELHSWTEDGEKFRTYLSIYLSRHLSYRRMYFLARSERSGALCLRER